MVIAVNAINEHVSSSAFRPSWSFRARNHTDQQRGRICSETW